MREVVLAVLVFAWVTLPPVGRSTLAAASQSPSSQSSAPAESDGTHSQAHDAEHADAPSLFCASCPVTRESSGTSWQPDDSNVHQRQWQTHGWWISPHVDVTLARTDERGTRGDDAFLSTNHVMVDARRRAGSGVVALRSKWSLEPTLGREGYPLLLQTGETADGVTALVDRQHPHDLPMELAAAYSRPLADGRAFFIYLAAIGEPALGPPAYMHRPSGALIPIAPISHHWLDSTHATYGVVTTGFSVSPAVKFEASLFRGREPDQHHWGFERPELDSYSFRLSVTPTSRLAFQVSAGALHNVEQIHPKGDFTRLTGSLQYARRWSHASFDGTAAWGRNRRGATLGQLPDGTVHYVPGGITRAVLLEGTLRVFGRHAVVSRFERAEKDELFPFPDLRHNVPFPVKRLTTGYVLDVLTTSVGRIGVGSAVSWSWVPAAIESDYGGPPASFLVFLRLSTH